MNHITLTGRTTKDLELRSTATGKDSVMFSLAVNDGKNADGEPITDFINITAYGERAVLLHKYVHKGDLIGIEGKLKPYVKEDENRNRTTYYSVVTDRIEFLNTKRADAEEKEESVRSISQDEIELSNDELPF
jgi:single-strand DNA-binding protein